MRSWEFLVIFSLTYKSISTQECITPNGYRSECKLLDDCAPLVNYMQRRPHRIMSRQEKQYINLLLCYTGEADEQYVCCASNDRFYETSSTSTTTTTEIPNRINYGEYNLPDPLNFECGIDVLKHRIAGGNETELGEYPWMALLEYEHQITQLRSFSCSGSLIHQRYILTAAHCLTGSIITRKGPLVNVRLGEHNKITEPDCELMGTDIFCADSVIDVGVEYAIAHPNFTIKSNGLDNDIGLIRLARDIQKTMFIQPICFPLNDMFSQDGMVLTVSGWGRTNSGLSSSVKQQVQVPIVNYMRCQDALSQVAIDNETQICAGGVFGMDSCVGDSGGPLMTFKHGIWYIEAIVSFGARAAKCGESDLPAIYTRVNAYRHWLFGIMV